MNFEFMTIDTPLPLCMPFPRALTGDTDKINKYSALLYAQAQLIEGLPVDDPTAYAEAVCSLMK